MLKPITRAAAYAVGIWAAFTGAVALAQAATPLEPLDLTPYFRDAGTLSLLTVAVVAFVKARVPDLKGPSVIFVSIVVGALLGIAGALAGVVPGGALAGVLLGVSSALTGSGGWDAVAGLVTKAGEANAQAQVRAALAMTSAQQTATAGIATPLMTPSPQALADYLIDLLRARFGANIPAFAWTLLATLTQEFAGKVLTEDVRAAIQRRLLDLLAAAGAAGQDL